MAKCVVCGKERVVSVSAKCSDLCHFCHLKNGGGEDEGYVPNDLGIGGGDYIEFQYCLECGLIQGGAFPRPKTRLEEEGEDDGSGL